MKRFTLLFSLLATVLLFASCSKEHLENLPPVDESEWLSKPRGVVVETYFGCSYYIVQTNRGYSVLRNWGSGTPFNGSVIYGQLNQWGVSTFYNRSGGYIFRADVHDYGLSYFLAEDAIRWNCGTSIAN